MLTRRMLGLGNLVILATCLSGARQLRADGLLEVRVRADEVVRGVLPPIALRSLTISPDMSPTARELQSRAPAERAAPVILIIVGALALVQIVEMINEMVRQFYYGGVIIDGRKTPPEITNDPKIPAHVILVFQADGTVKQFSAGELPSSLLETVLKAKL
jgi:hypothetical protein